MPSVRPARPDGAAGGLPRGRKVKAGDWHIDLRTIAGSLAAAFVSVLVGGALVGLAFEGAADFPAALAAFDSYLFRIARFTLWQAALSTALSILPAMLVARALSRHPRFPGRRLILRLFALPLALPAIVAALGILALLGRAGYFADLLSGLAGHTWPGIYGLSGILVAHVFFNLPLATRLFLETLDTLPADQWRLASQLGMNASSSFRLIEWPALRAVLPGIAGLVFMLCITSFTVVLTLGGGPAATTLEVAIYQALRFDFDPARAVALTFIQIGLTALAVLFLNRLGANAVIDANLSVAPRRPATAGRPETLFNAVLVLLSVALVAGPMLATVTAGLNADLLRLAGDA
ncbi:MAG: transport system permease protein, partial [Rhizobiaceae bacterium]|nr:transport system permease protein [Rhizobiaceae bacterium]